MPKSLIQELSSTVMNEFYELEYNLFHPDIGNKYDIENPLKLSKLVDKFYKATASSISKYNLNYIRFCNLILNNNFKKAMSKKLNIKAFPEVMEELHEEGGLYIRDLELLKPDITGGRAKFEQLLERLELLNNKLPMFLIIFGELTEKLRIYAKNKAIESTQDYLELLPAQIKEENPFVPSADMSPEKMQRAEARHDRRVHNKIEAAKIY